MTQKLDGTNKCYLAQKKVVLFNCIFYQENCPMSVSSLANCRSVYHYKEYTVDPRFSEP